jgi:hypothetical protein
MEHPIPGARLLVVKELTAKELSAMSWKDICCQNFQLTGNTKFDDFPCIAAFFKCNMVLRYAAAMVGYAFPEEGGSNNLADRILRHNSEDLLAFAHLLIKAGKLPKDFCTTALEGGPARGRISEAKKHVVKGIIKSAIKKTGGKKKAAIKLKVDLKTINKWLNA